MNFLSNNKKISSQGKLITVDLEEKIFHLGEVVCVVLDAFN